MVAKQDAELFANLNRYEGREEQSPSDVVFKSPRRTLTNGWSKFHATTQCGSGRVVYVENTSRVVTGEAYEYSLRCLGCGRTISEDEVLFIGGEWWTAVGVVYYGRTLRNLRIPASRVLELGPSPSESELIDAIRITRIEQQSGNDVIGATDSDKVCESCGHDIPLSFDGKCRMCYDGPWTDGLTRTLEVFERQVRESNNSFVHRLPKKVDPFSIKDRLFTGKILWRFTESGLPKLIVVRRCLQRDSDSEWEYVVSDLNHDAELLLDTETIQENYWDTGLNHEGDTSPVADNLRLKELYNQHANILH